jgi:hypothetical protein
MAAVVRGVFAGAKGGVKKAMRRGHHVAS